MSIQESHVKSLEVFRKYEMNMLEGLRTRYWRRNYDTREKFPLIFSKQNIHVYLQMMLGFKLLHKLNNTKNKQGKIVK